MSTYYRGILRKYLNDVNWLGLANLNEMYYSHHVYNEFYFGILLKKND